MSVLACTELLLEGNSDESERSLGGWGQGRDTDFYCSLLHFLDFFIKWDRQDTQLCLLYIHSA